MHLLKRLYISYHDDEFNTDISVSKNYDSETITEIIANNFAKNGKEYNGEVIFHNKNDKIYIKGSFKYIEDFKVILGFVGSFAEKILDINNEQYDLFNVPKRYTKLLANAIIENKSQDNDCAITAISIVCDKTYEEVADALRLYGKKDNDGTNIYTSILTIASFGYTVKQVNCNDYLKQYKTKNQKYIKVTDIEKYPDVFKNSTNQLLMFDNHICALMDGKVEDIVNDIEDKKINTILQVSKSNFGIYKYMKTKFMLWFARFLTSLKIKLT